MPVEFEILRAPYTEAPPGLLRKRLHAGVVVLVDPYGVCFHGRMGCQPQFPEQHTDVPVKMLLPDDRERWPVGKKAATILEKGALVCRKMGYCLHRRKGLPSPWPLREQRLCKIVSVFKMEKSLPFVGRPLAVAARPPFSLAAVEA